MSTLEVDQVAIVVRNIENTIKQLSSLWNIGPFEIKEIDVPDAVVHGKQTRVKAKIAFAQAGRVQLELIEPGEGDNIYQEFLRAKGEGLHHLGIRVSDIESEVSRLKEKGIDVLQSANTQRVNFVYLDTEGITGSIFEFRQFKQNPL